MSTLYLSFDGLTPRTNIKNHWEIPGVLKNCREAGLGMVLVPTVINGTNDGEIGDILRFGFKNNDVVRGINFQPVSLVGMMPRRQREKQRIVEGNLIEPVKRMYNESIQLSQRWGKEFLDFWNLPEDFRFNLEGA